jgi:hypothetical protein
MKLWEREAWDVCRELAILSVSASLFIPAYQHKCPVTAAITLAILVQHLIPLLLDGDGFLTEEMVVVGAFVLACTGAYRRSRVILFAVRIVI